MIRVVIARGFSLALVHGQAATGLIPKWQPRVEHRQVAGGRAGRQQQLNFRGRGGQQVIKPGGGGTKLTRPPLARSNRRDPISSAS